MAKCSRAQMLQTARCSAYINSKNRPKLPIGVMKVRVKFRVSCTDVKRWEMGSRPYHYLGVACNATEPQSIKEVFFSQACLKRHYIIGQALRYTCTGDRLLRTCAGCFLKNLIFCVSGTARFLSFSWLSTSILFQFHHLISVVASAKRFSSVHLATAPATWNITRPRRFAKFWTTSPTSFRTLPASSENFGRGFWELWPWVLRTCFFLLLCGFCVYSRYCPQVLRTWFDTSENLARYFWELWGVLLRTWADTSEKFGVRPTAPRRSLVLGRIVLVRLQIHFMHCSSSNVTQHQLTIKTSTIKISS